MKIIIYLPGLGYDYYDISGFNYAQRYMSTLDKMNKNKSKKYLLEKKEMSYGFENKNVSQVTSIFEYEVATEQKEETFRIYEFYYANNLINKFEHKNIILKFIQILLTLMSKSILFLRVLLGKRKFLSKKKRLESFYFFLILCLIAIFSLLLFPAIITSLVKIIDQIFINDKIFNDSNKWVTFANWITTTTAFLTSVIPNFRDFISKISTEFLCLDYYLSLSDNKLEIVGGLETLVEKISESESYSSMELHGYSFGSIIIIDTLFPYGVHPTRRVSEEIKKIVTIGCPHDFINTYYPTYFLTRSLSKDSHLNSWYNVYSDIDILSSNFRSDDRKENGQFRVSETCKEVHNVFFNVINPKSLSLWNHIGIIGIRTHRMFWGKDIDSSNCLGLIIENESNL